MSITIPTSIVNSIRQRAKSVLAYYRKTTDKAEIRSVMLVSTTRLLQLLDIADKRSEITLLAKDLAYVCKKVRWVKGQFGDYCPLCKRPRIGESNGCKRTCQMKKLVKEVEKHVD